MRFYAFNSVFLRLDHLGTRRVGTSYTPEQFLKRKKSLDILKLLDKGGLTYKQISILTGVSQTTISKVKKMSQLVNGDMLGSK